METKRVLRVTERAFAGQVEDLCRLFQWRYYHSWNSMHSPPGFPDYLLLKGARLLFVELKTDTGKLTIPQRDWLTALAAAGKDVFLWRPQDFEEVRDILAGHAEPETGWSTRWSEEE